jgi:putative aldouronate transport system permease protein
MLKAASVNPESIKMAITMVATLPILCVYPFVQKYFVSGMTLGAVKS